MSRASYRGLSTPERIRPQLLVVDEPGSPAIDREEPETEERTRNLPLWETCFPHSMRLWIKQNLSFSSHASTPNKHSVKPFDKDSKSGKSCDSPGSLSTNSSSGVGTGVSAHGGSYSCINRKISPFALLPFLLVCIIGALVLLSVLGSNRSNPRVVFPPHNHRRAQILAWRNLLRGGILGRGSLVSDPPVVAACPSVMKDYIPCYDVAASLGAGSTDGSESQSHCDLRDKIRCLVPAPKLYDISLKWPESRDFIWSGNVEIDAAVIESRLFVEDKKLKFPATDERLIDEVDGYAQKIADVLDLAGVKDFIGAGIRSVLDLECGFGSLGAYLWGHDMVTLCVSPYEEHGGQVQITLERGLPAMIGSLATTQLPYPSSSFDLIHCAKCDIETHLKDGLPLIEIDRLLRVGGYFVFMSTGQEGLGSQKVKVWKDIKNLTSSLGWEVMAPLERDMIAVWKKRAPRIATMTQKLKLPFCDQDESDPDWTLHHSLRSCVTVPPYNRQMSVHDQLVWPARVQLAPIDSSRPGTGPGHDEATGEPHTWATAVVEYWSLLTPVIFSDHPKRLGDEDVKPAANLVRNMMDLNAGNGALNAALILAGVPVWVMNVIPTSAVNSLPAVFDRGLIGAGHDWCQPFPTYPRTYDLLHASDLLSLELKREDSCGLAYLFLEMDRILRPEGWVFLRDEAVIIEDARSVATQLRWESRLIEVIGDTSQQLLVCQKTFWKA